MTLLITVFAAAICTGLWYQSEKAAEMKIGVLCWMFWGASLMWLVDAIFEFAELKADYFTPALRDMINDAFLGLSVVALGLIVWVIVLLVKDPQGKVRAAVFKKSE